MSGEPISIPAGTHIEAAAVMLVSAANTAGLPVSAMFNGIELRAEPDSSPAEIVVAFGVGMADAATSYAASLEGKAAARRSAKEVAGLQATADRLAERVNRLDFADQRAVLDFLAGLQPASDRIGVHVRSAQIVDAFAEHGLTPNMCCGPAFDETDRDNFYRWLVGQALDGITRGPAIHGVFHKFADQWRSRWPLAPKPQGETS